MSEQQNLSIKGDAGETKRDTTQILNTFEREIIGLIRNIHGVVGSKTMNEINKTIDKYMAG